MKALVAAPRSDGGVPGLSATRNGCPESPIAVASGLHAGAVLHKSLAIVGRGQATIASGPLHPAGLVQGFRLANGSSGTTISHLTFSGVDLAVFVATGPTSTT
jgi:hypothetical protein